MSLASPGFHERTPNASSAYSMPLLPPGKSAKGTFSLETVSPFLAQSPLPREAFPACLISRWLLISPCVDLLGVGVVNLPELHDPAPGRWRRAAGPGHQPSVAGA